MARLGVVLMRILSLVSLVAVICSVGCMQTPDGYAVSTLQTGAGLEYRLKYSEDGQTRHFGTLTAAMKNSPTPSAPFLAEWRTRLNPTTLDSPPRTWSNC